MNYEYLPISELKKDIWHTAQALCSEIKDFPTDLIISLAHSGWMPTYAARLVWEAKETQPFPPAVRINLGREKAQLYAPYLPEPAGEPFFGLTDMETAWLWAWMRTSTGWADELKEIVDQAVQPGYTPQHILIVDEYVYIGKTAALAMAVSMDAYPGAQVRFVSAHMDGWCECMARAWLDERHPQLLEKLPSSRQDGDSNAHHLNDRIAMLVPGTEDTTTSSLNWQEIRPGSPLLASLEALLPASEWLKLPQWADATVQEAIADMLEEEKQGGAVSNPFYRMMRMEFEPRHILLRELLLGREPVKEEILDFCQLSEVEAARLLSKLGRAGLVKSEESADGIGWRLAPGQEAARLDAATTSS